MAGDFSLEAIITASIDGFTSGMDAIVAAATSAGEALRDQLTGGSEEADASLETLKGKTEETASGMSESFDSIKESILHVVEVMGVLEGANLLREQVNQALEFGESMQKLSISTGSTTNFLQQLKFAGDATGTSMDNLTMIAGRLQRAYASIQSGSGSPQLLSSLKNAGVDASSLSSFQSGIEAVAAAVKKFGENSGVARNLVLQLFSRNGLNLLPVLAQFDELQQKANDLHIVLPPEMLESLDKGKESLNILGSVFEADAARIASGFAPAVSQAAEKLTEFFAEAAKSGELDRWAKTLETDFNKLADAVKGIDFSKLESAASGASTVLTALAHAVEGDFMAMQDLLALIDRIRASESSWKPANHTPGPDNEHGQANQRLMMGGLHGGGVMPPPPPTPQPQPTATTTDQSVAATESASKMAEAVKKAQTEALQAYQEQLSSFTEEQAMEVATSTNTADAKVQAATNVYNKAVELIGQTGAVSAAGYAKEVQDAQKAGVAMLNAERERLAQTKALNASGISDVAAEQAGQLQVQKSALAEELAAHQITKQQELAGEQSLVQQTLALDINKYNQLAANAAGDVAKQQEYNAAKVKAFQTAQEQMLAYQTQALDQQDQQTQKAATAMGQEFEKGLSTVEQAFQTKGTTWRSIMQSAAGDIEGIFNHLIETMAEKWLENSKLFQNISGGLANIGPNFSAGMANGGGIIGGVKGVFGMGPTAPGAPGAAPVGGLGAQQVIPPGSLNAPIQTAFQASASTLGQSFSQAFQASQGALNSVFSAAMRSAASSAPAAGGGGGAAAPVAATAPAGGGSDNKMIALSTAQLGVQILSMTHLGKISAAQEAMQGIMMAIEIIDLMIALRPMILGTGAAGAFVGSDFGPPANDGKGGVIGVVHPGERIIPAAYVDQHTRQLKASAMSMPKMSPGAQQMSSGDGGGGNGGSGGHHIEIHTHGDYSSLDSSGMDSILSQHGGAIADEVMNRIGPMGRRERYR